MSEDGKYITMDWRLAGSIYRDQSIFDGEIANIFHKCWIYIGHETEIPAGGDYKRGMIGRQPVVMVRGADDEKVRIFFNRCRHRAATVCQRESGNANHFRCAYHGWTYGNDGRLIGVPFPDAYGEELDKSTLGLAPVAQVEGYRGFVFATLDPAAPRLREYLGHATRYLDYISDLDVELSAGAQRLVYSGNWKLQIENTIDAYHFAFTHKSWLDVLKRRTGETSEFTAGVANNPTWRTLDLQGGHAAAEFGALDDSNDRPAMGLGDLLPFNLIVFPSLGFVGSHLRIVRPVDVCKTEVLLYPMFPKGSDETEKSRILRDHEAFYGPSGAGSTDDVEVGFDRVSNGLQASATPDDWLLISRGLEREVVDPVTGIKSGRPADEVPQRAFYRRWSELVVADE